MAVKIHHQKPVFEIAIVLLIVLSSLIVYGQVRNFDFIHFDDPTYVSQNKEIQQGLTVDSIIWAFTTVHAASWHPVTWVSHMLDYQLFGLNSGMHHMTSVFLHIVNSLLLFFIFRKMTGNLWRSAMIAALFAFHPLHVESVAWVSERKDVLSTLFWMMTVWSYLAYVDRPSGRRYAAVVLFFILGLMSKPMLVTLPFVLLLLDYWPLNRISFLPSTEQKDALAWALVREKIPLFTLVFLSCGMTYYAQQKGGALAPLDAIPMAARITNSIVAYIGYIGKMIYPIHLACLYPHPGILPWWKVLASGLLIAALSVAAFGSARKYPYVIVGWLWYLGTLVPVIGIVQVGSQSMADRYTYVPAIGLLLVVVWGLPELFREWRLYGKKALAEKSLKYVGIDNYIVLKPETDNPWRNSGKLVLLKKFLESEKHRFKYILYLDSADVILRDAPQTALTYLRSQKCDLLFSRTAFAAGYECMRDVETWTKNIAEKSGHPDSHLNTGVYIGTADFLKEVVNVALEFITDEDLTPEGS